MFDIIAIHNNGHKLEPVEVYAVNKHLAEALRTKSAMARHWPHITFALNPVIDPG